MKVTLPPSSSNPSEMALEKFSKQLVLERVEIMEECIKEIKEYLK